MVPFPTQARAMAKRLTGAIQKARKSVYGKACWTAQTTGSKALCCCDPTWIVAKNRRKNMPAIFLRPTIHFCDQYDSRKKSSKKFGGAKIYFLLRPIVANFIVEMND